MIINQYLTIKTSEKIQHGHLRLGMSSGTSIGMVSGTYLRPDKALRLSYISKRPYNSKSSFLEWITKEYRYKEGLPL